MVSKDNKTLKNDLDSHVCHASPSSIPIACSTSSSHVENDIIMLKKSVNCLGSTLSKCAMNHTRLESMFRKKHTPYIHAHKPRHTHASHVTHMTLCLLIVLHIYIFYHFHTMHFVNKTLFLTHFLSIFTGPQLKREKAN